jgi:hypothetical protein
MCWNEEVSIASFVVGVTISISVGYLSWKQGEIHLAVISIFWIWSLLMQLFDYFVWSNKCNVVNNKNLNRIGYMLNITQPIILYLCLINLSPGISKENIICSVVVFIYIIWFLAFSLEFDKNQCPRKKSIKHLEYPWWSNNDVNIFRYENIGTILYIISISVCLLLLMKPFPVALGLWIYIIVTLLISVFYIYDGAASIWCWFAVITPLVGYIILKNTKTTVKK